MAHGRSTSDRRHAARRTVGSFAANVLLDEWIGKLERRGHRFVRYAETATSRQEPTGGRAGVAVAATLLREAGAANQRSKTAVGVAWNVSLGYRCFRQRPRRSQAGISAHA